MLFSNFLVNSGKTKAGEIIFNEDLRFSLIFWYNYESDPDINNLYYYSYQDIKNDNILLNIKN